MLFCSDLTVFVLVAVRVNPGSDLRQIQADVDDELCREIRKRLGRPRQM